MLEHAPIAALVAASVCASTVAVQHAVGAGRSAALSARLAPDPFEPGPPAWFREVLESSGLSASPDRAWKSTVRGAAITAALMAWRWPQLVVAGAVLGAAGTRMAQRSRARGEQRRFDTTLVEVIDGLVSRLATGTSLAVAVSEAAAHPSAVGRDLDEVMRRHRHGQALQTAIDGWAVARATAGVRLLADALAIAGASGGSQRAALLGVQATLRDRESLGREVRALASQARTSGIVLALTPAAFAGLVAMVDADVAAFFSSPAGWACLLVGALLDAGGAVWMHRLTEAHQ